MVVEVVEASHNNMLKNVGPKPIVQSPNITILKRGQKLVRDEDRPKIIAYTFYAYFGPWM